MTTIFFHFWDGFSAVEEVTPTPDPTPAPAAPSRGGGGGGGGGGYRRPGPPATLRRKKRNRLDQYLEEPTLIEEPVPVVATQEDAVSAESLSAEQRRRHRRRLEQEDEAFILSRGRGFAVWAELLGA